jgi:universal stress protein E
MRRFRDILALVPSGPDAAHVIAHAGELASRNGGKLTVFDSVPQLNERRSRLQHRGGDIDMQQLLATSRKAEIEKIVADVGVHAEVAVDTGIPFVVTIQRVIRNEHDLVITAPDGHGTNRGGLRGATTTLHLLRKCPSPVWVDDPLTHARRDVLIAIGPFSGMDSADVLDQQLFELGTSLAKLRDGKVHLVRAWRLEGESLLRSGAHRIDTSEVDALVDFERSAASRAFDSLVIPEAAGDVEIEQHVVEGSAADVIAEVAERTHAGVVVMGTLARAGLPGLIIGNTAERLLSYLDASIIAVKPPGFTSPVKPG